jgi:hypothetical protein
VPHSKRGPSPRGEQVGGLNSREVMRACSPSYQGSARVPEFRASDPPDAGCGAGRSGALGRRIGRDALRA